MTLKPPPPRFKLSGIASKILSAFVYWHKIVRNIPKIHRYSLGLNIEKLFADLVQLVATAQFSPKEKRPNLISEAISKNDVLKFTLYALWELEGIQESHFLELAPRLEEIGRMLYGWLQKMISESK